MAIQLPQGFDIRSAESIDKRIVLTKAEMLAANDNIMPAVYLAVCKDDNRFYIYKKAASIDPVLGKFRPVEEYLTYDTEAAKAQFDTIIKDNDTIKELQEWQETVVLDGGEITREEN